MAPRRRGRRRRRLGRAGRRAGRERDCLDRHIRRELLAGTALAQHLALGGRRRALRLAGRRRALRLAGCRALRLTGRRALRLAGRRRALRLGRVSRHRGICTRCRRRLGRAVVRYRLDGLKDAAIMPLHHRLDQLRRRLEQALLLLVERHGRRPRNASRTRAPRRMRRLAILRHM